MKASIRPHIYLHLAVLLFGAAGVLGKILALAPLTLVFGRSLFAALSLLPIVLWKRDGNWRRAGKRAVLCGALLAMHWLSFLQHCNARQWHSVCWVLRVFLYS